MKAVVQRVQRGGVSVGEETLAEIQEGVVILLGVSPQDDEAVARKLAEKIARMRIFPDENRKMNISLLDISGEALVIPQFTLFADTRRGHRPSFTDAGPPEIAEPLSTYFAECLRALGIPTGEGKFGAHMVVEIINDGPVTISLEM
ncbi:MAG TPA: D-tyrosyl-tRNA(Tyr) deacylase [Chloroflexi bacterium]|nr:MAG: D-tyrosyl-tRNA(Tyr) deacylase [Chloroflexota bacterium]HDD56172.1 D-tyrosyl-tRNA(Tyr) deacylase [Chloroflexota bacterium]